MSWIAIIALAVVVLAVAFIVAAYLRNWPWAGLAAEPESKRPAKTVWDWLQLLVIPLCLAVAAYALNVAQTDRAQRSAERRAKIDQQLAAEQRAADRQLAAEQHRDDVLEAYLEQMSKLILDRNLNQSRPGAEVREVAQTLTVNVLESLDVHVLGSLDVDGRRKGVVLHFLAEAGLIESGDPIVLLQDANLHGVELHGHLVRADLSNADLHDADFSGARLASLTMTSATLRGANFTHAKLTHAQLAATDLTHANFATARIEDSVFVWACLSATRFSRASLERVRLDEAQGHDADFSRATFTQVNFQYPDLLHIVLRGIRSDKDSHLPTESEGSGKCLAED
jgi:uncharacterized protein YjbI with pentapeptide repeats